MEPIAYHLIRSGRKTLALEISREGEVIVQAPYRVSQRVIREFVASREGWIAEKQEIQRRRASDHPPLTAEQLAILAQRAREILPGRVEHYAALMGVAPAGLTITSARTRFGSCSPKNRICFSCRLMAYPEEAIDYVVVHELAHILQHNHSPAFWAEVEKILPDYRRREALLRQ